MKEKENLITKIKTRIVKKVLDLLAVVVKAQ